VARPADADWLTAGADDWKRWIVMPVSRIAMNRSLYNDFCMRLGLWYLSVGEDTVHV